MFRLTRATEQQIAAFLATQRELTFSYAEVGCTRGAPPPGYVLDHIHPRGAPTIPGTDVAVVVRHFGFWSLNACRVLHDVDDEPEPGVRRIGFAYGTLPAHGEIGEERFTVEWHAADDSVWYDVYALSKPGHPLVRLAYPLARHLQHRFARDSKQAMIDASTLRDPVAE
jgi:hypothetical protein